MSDERIKKIVSVEPVKPNPSSIMSAPRDKKKTERQLIIIIALVLSLILNVVLAIVSLSKNERMSQLERDNADYKSENTELKNELNSLRPL